MHVAIIMDGNRRWAAARGLPAIEGYRRGIGALREAVRGAVDAGVQALTVYGFSKENWNRGTREVDVLMGLCAFFARNERRAMQRRNVRVRVIGEIDAFAAPARAALAELVRSTSGNTGVRLNLALNYSGRAEILRAVRALAADARDGRVHPDEIDERVLRERLYDLEAGDPDLLIRTGGEQRLSNFLLYHVAYTELMTLPIMWPDFGAAHLSEAVRGFGVRERRFGA